MDVFFFYPLNLLILKVLGKKIICTFRGADVRSKVDILSYDLFSKSKKTWPKYFENLYVKENIFKKIKRTLRMKIFCALSDKIVLTGPFLVSSVDCFDKIIPYARDIKYLEKIPTKKHRLTVVHAPTAFDVKGTYYVKQAFKNLKKKYSQVDFKIITGLSHDDLLKELANGDIIVDQLIVGWYGGLAAEAMVMGKVVLANLNPVYFQFVDFSKQLPVYNTNVWQLENDLEMLINSPEERNLRSARGAKFAKKYHDCQKVANQYLELYRGSDE
jgi:glycosyltransferase involved in cell wall biosynthesis